MGIYLDTSVLVSVYVREKHSKKILDLLEKNKEPIYISRLVEAEFYSALVLKKRTQALSQENFKKISDFFQKHITESFYNCLHLTDDTFSHAIELLQSGKTGFG